MKNLILAAGVAFTAYTEMSHGMAGAHAESRFIVAAIILVPTVLLYCLIRMLGARHGGPPAPPSPAPRPRPGGYPFGGPR